MMTLPTGSKIRGVDRARAGFTLIEFVLVMTMLLVVFGVSTPMLSKFFRGRTLDVEARRFLALTHYGQSRAVSESVPMILWIDPGERTYGLEREYGYEPVDAKAVVYDIDPGLETEAVLAGHQTRNVSLGQSAAARRNLPMIRFQPDGFVSPESIHGVRFQESDDAEKMLWVAQSRSGLAYEIQTNLLYSAALNR